MAAASGPCRSPVCDTPMADLPALHHSAARQRRLPPALLHHPHLRQHLLRRHRQRPPGTDARMQVAVKAALARSLARFVARPDVLDPLHRVAVVAAIRRRRGAERAFRQRSRLHVAPAQRRARAGQTALGAHHQPLLLRVGAGRGDFDLHGRRARRAQHNQHVVIGVAEGAHPVAHAGHLRFGGAEQQQPHVDQVRTGVVHRPAAIALQGLPVPAARESVMGDAHHHDPAEHPGGGYFAHLDHVAAIAVVLKHGEQLAGLGRRRGHPLGVGHAGGHRFLAHHVLAGAQRRDAVVGVQMARHRHHHHVDAGIGQQRREIPVRGAYMGGAGEPLHRLVAPHRQRIVHRRHPDLVGQSLDQPRMDAPPATPEPHDTNPYLRFHMVTIARMSRYHLQR